MIRPAVTTLAGAIRRAKRENRFVLTEIESKEVLARAGIPVTQAGLATSAAEAGTLAKKIGFPVVLKIVSPDITHKSDVGGVMVGLDSKKAVEAGYSAILRAVKKKQPKARIEGVAVQKMAPEGTQVIVGMSKDPQFGPVIMFGLGGVLVEVLKDVSFRIVPLEKRDAAQMVREIKGYPILEGVRGREPADVPAIESLILKLSAFAEANPQIEEIDLNPVFAYPDGVIAVDARIVIGDGAQGQA
jgi:acyl-CoA synthetase (NDP forming)